MKVGIFRYVWIKSIEEVLFTEKTSTVSPNIHEKVAKNP